MVLNVHALVQHAHDDNVVPSGAIKDLVMPHGCASIPFANVVTHHAKIRIGSQAQHLLVKRAKVLPRLFPTPRSPRVAADLFQVLLRLGPNQVFA